LGLSLYVSVEKVLSLLPVYQSEFFKK
jgi:hypothetical protein